jgi:hypothetical protein
MVKNRIYLSTALAVVGYFLGIVADATRETGLAIYYVSCFGKIILFLTAFRLATSAGKIIRKELNIIGIPGLRYASKIMFGVALSHFILFMFWNLIPPGTDILPDGQITIDASLFFIATILRNAESWNCYKMIDQPSLSACNRRRKIK